MSQYLLNLIQSPATVDQEGRILMAQIMNLQMIKSRLPAQSPPHFMDRGVGFTGLLVDEQIILKTAVEQKYNRHSAP